MCEVDFLTHSQDAVVSRTYLDGVGSHPAPILSSQPSGLYLQERHAQYIQI